MGREIGGMGGGQRTDLQVEKFVDSLMLFHSEKSLNELMTNVEDWDLQRRMNTNANCDDDDFMLLLPVQGYEIEP